MAMTKKERAEMERLREDLALAKAMRWPEYPLPEPVAREWIDANRVDGGVRYGHRQRVARGWFYNAYLASLGYQRVTHGCSDGIHHSSDGDATSSQGMGRMYATELEALHGLRLELTEQCARLLAGVDRQIEAATARAALTSGGDK